MSTQFQVDTGQITAASTDIRRISAQIESDVATMMARLTGLEDAWRGSASAGFQRVVSSWGVTQRQVRVSLDEIEAALSRAGAQYAQVEESNAMLFRG